MGSFFKPKTPAPPPLVLPEEKDIPSLEDEERRILAEEKIRETEKKRKGRRSTILTGTGLNEIEEENISKKTLLS